MKKLSLIALSVVLALMSSANLWAARYIFYFKDSNGQFHFMSAKSSHPGDVKSSDNPSSQSDYIWYCKSSSSTSTSYDATISTSSRYFYATNTNNYWLRTANGRAEQIDLSTSGGQSYSIDSNGYLREGTSDYFVYYQSSDGTWRTSDNSDTYNNKRPSYIEYTGSNINSTTVNSYPEAGGDVFVKGDISGVHENLNGGHLKTDIASRKYPAVYYLHAYPNSGYEFIGWSKTQGGTIVSTDVVYMVSVLNTNETYYANYRALTYTVTFVKNSTTATGTMDPVTPSIGADYTLPELGFVDNITVTFDANGGTFPAKGTNNYSETQSKFNNWSGSDGNTYANKGTINKSTGDAITLTAQWSANRAFTVPSATRGDRELRGYNHGETTWIKTTPGSTVWPTSSYTLYAVWGSPFYAQVNLSKTAGTSGTPTVDVAQKSSDTKNTDISFSITAPAPSSGYYFTGWTYSGTGVTITDSSSSSTTVKVKSASSAGSTNTATLTANYEEYTRIIVITASGTPSASGDRVVFNVVGPQTYRVSVPVGGSVTLKDVASGDYTITPQGWSWSYTVSPTNATTSWNSENKSTHTFNFTPKSSTKKHSEVSATVKP